MRSAQQGVMPFGQLVKGRSVAGVEGMQQLFVGRVHPHSRDPSPSSSYPFLARSYSPNGSARVRGLSGVSGVAHFTAPRCNNLPRTGRLPDRKACPILQANSFTIPIPSGFQTCTAEGSILAP